MSVRRRAFFSGGLKNEFSVNFDGSNDYVIAGNEAAFKYYHGATNTSAFAFSIGVWVKLTNPLANALQVIFNSQSLGTANIGISLVYDNRASVPATRRLSFVIARGVVSNAVIAVAANAVYPNSTDWVHVLWTYDQAIASANSNLYINNALVNTSNKTGNTPSTADATFPMVFGIQNTLSNFPLNGNLFGMAFINKVLSVGERAELYDNPTINPKRYTFAPNITNYFAFPKGQTNFPTWVDVIGNVNGTMTNQVSTQIQSDTP